VLAIEQAKVVVELDPYLSLKALASYSGLSVRRLRDLLSDPAHPLPHYKVGGKILVRRSSFDRWIEFYNATPDVSGVVNEVVSDLLH
jgi:excisionase family DNA binding protein